MNEPYLAHYGVKGMKWGVRKAGAKLRKRAEKGYDRAKRKVREYDKRMTPARRRKILRGALTVGSAGLALYEAKKYSDQFELLGGRPIKTAPKTAYRYAKRRNTQKKYGYVNPGDFQGVTVTGSVVHSEPYLAHYGVKGMKWGVRKDRIRQAAKAKYKKASLAASKRRQFARDVSEYERAFRGRYPYAAPNDKQRKLQREYYSKVRARGWDPKYREKVAKRGRANKALKKQIKRAAYSGGVALGIAAYAFPNAHVTSVLKESMNRKVSSLKDQQDRKKRAASKTRYPRDPSSFRYDAHNRAYNPGFPLVALPASSRTSARGAGSSRYSTEFIDGKNMPDGTRVVKGNIVGKVVDTPIKHSNFYSGYAMGDEYFLAHYGVKGMKWGVRKAGDKIKSRIGERKARKAGKFNSDDFNSTIHIRKKKPSELSNAELRALNDRLNLERNYSQLTARKRSGAEKLAREIGKGVLVASVAAAVTPYAKQYAKNQVKRAARTKVATKVSKSKVGNAMQWNTTGFKK